jgi:hypothetical protein
MPAHHHHDDDDLSPLATLDAVDLSRVTGGAGLDMSSMLPMMMMMMMMKQRSAAAAPPPAPAPAWTPKVLVDGVEQAVNSSANGTTFTSST